MLDVGGAGSHGWCRCASWAAQSCCSGHSNLHHAGTYDAQACKYANFLLSVAFCGRPCCVCDYCGAHLLISHISCTVSPCPIMCLLGCSCSCSWLKEASCWGKPVVLAWNFHPYVQDECVLPVFSTSPGELCTFYNNYGAHWIWLCTSVWVCMKGMWLCVRGTWVRITGTDSIARHPCLLVLCAIYCSWRMQYALQEGPPSMVSMHWKGVVCGAPSSVLSRQQWKGQRNWGTLLRWFLLINETLIMYVIL